MKQLIKNIQTGDLTFGQVVAIAIVVFIIAIVVTCVVNPGRFYQ